jgi:mannose-1-phosphate guanylyltransferase / mannose-6-phosphate isomerase
MISITPILLAGGTGSRLWPLSRESYPKQFSKFFDHETLFQKSALRFISSNSLKFDSPITLTNSQYRFIVYEQLLSVGINPGPIFIEPESKNTAPAILAASLHSFEKDKNSILIVAPSDHLIPNVKEFHKVIKIGLEEVNNNKIITFGIKPNGPNTGYGYLELNEFNANKAVKVNKFIEKPNFELANKMFKLNNFLWNSGIFLFRAEDMISLAKKYTPELLLHVRNAVKNAKIDLSFLRLNPLSWSACENISIDYAIMEKAKNINAVPFIGNWSDLGDWNSVWQEMIPDPKGISTTSNAHAFDCKNTLLRNESKDQTIIGFGLDNIVAVAMPDAVLVANKNRTQDLKSIVNTLENINISQINNFEKDHRPWGSFEILSKSEKYQVKRICVNVNGVLSLQSHKYRSEHWIVVKGTAKVTLDKEVKLLQEGESIYIPLQLKHRLENPNKSPLILIEVQTGTYFGEDDIIRYEDIYSRN